MYIIENDKCLITLCPVDEDPTRENIVNLCCRETEELLVTSDDDIDSAKASYKNAINLSLYDDSVIYKNRVYRIIHMLTISNTRFVENYQHKYTHTYNAEA